MSTSKVFAIGAVCLSTAACNLTPEAVSTDLQSLSIARSIETCADADNRNVSPYTYLRLGFSEVRAQCKAFFDGATELNRNSNYSRRVLATGSIAATAAITATNPAVHAAKALALTAVGVTLADALIEEFATQYGFLKYTYRIEENVKQAMDTYATNTLNGVEHWQNTDQKTPDNYCIAQTYIRDFASFCTISSLQLTLDRIVANPTVSVTLPPLASGPISQVQGVERRLAIGPSVARMKALQPPRLGRLPNNSTNSVPLPVR